MLHKGMHKNEIVEILEGKGDFVKIDYLNRYLKSMPPIEMRKFAYVKLAEIYLLKEMYKGAATMYKNASINSITFREKQKYYVKESKAFILAGDYIESDKAMKKAFTEANIKEKKEIYGEILRFYKKEAIKLEEQKKPGQLVKIYEKLIRMQMMAEDKEEIREKLLKLYERLGKIKEHNTLKNLGNF